MPHRYGTACRHPTLRSRFRDGGDRLWTHGCLRVPGALETLVLGTDGDQLLLGSRQRNGPPPQGLMGKVDVIRS